MVGIKKNIKTKKITKNKVIKKKSLNLKVKKSTKKISNNIKTKKIVKKKVIKKNDKKNIVKKVAYKKITSNPKKLKKKVTLVKKTKKINKIKLPKIQKKSIKVNKELKPKIELERSSQNPILKPNQNFWESEAVFNPGALYLDNKVHLFYRAMGSDGISRIGYAMSKDGINFERLNYPIFSLQEFENLKKTDFTSPARIFNPNLYTSGGGWGGCEDPRVVCIENTIYITLNIFNGWHSLRVAVLSISKNDFLNRNWKWKKFVYLSHDFDRQKNWVLFPEKINNKFAVFHNLDMNDGNVNNVGITLTDMLGAENMPFGRMAPDPQRLPDKIIAWHKRTRSIACPPVKTKEGWLVLYHAMDKDGSDRYKLGAMLLDLKDVKKVLYRSNYPILESKNWYENDYKPGIIYASGAVVIGDDLFVYYGGGDKTVNLATIKLSLLIKNIKENKEFKLLKILNKK